MAADPDIITVEILGTKLQLRGGDNPDAVRHAAAYVAQHVQSIVDRAPTAPSIQVALLAALNIADELLQEQTRDSDVYTATAIAHRILEKANQV